MAAEHLYFFEDEVYRVNKKGYIEFGMVLQNSELLSSDENSDNEDTGKLKKGYIRVAWHPTGTEEVVSERKVIVVCAFIVFKYFELHSLTYCLWCCNNFVLVTFFL